MFTDVDRPVLTFNGRTVLGRAGGEDRMFDVENVENFVGVESINDKLLTTN